jgi:GxxExxY protein
MSNYQNHPHSEITGKIIQGAFNVYNELGFGFLESVYEKALYIELMKMGLPVIRQYPIEVFFEEEKVGDFRADLIVDGVVIVEIKAAEALHEKHEAQLLNYLKATDIELGLLINFGEEIQIKRRIFSK